MFATSGHPVICNTDNCGRRSNDVCWADSARFLTRPRLVSGPAVTRGTVSAFDLFARPTTVVVSLSIGQFPRQYRRRNTVSEIGPHSRCCHCGGRHWASRGTDQSHRAFNSGTVVTTGIQCTQPSPLRRTSGICSEVAGVAPTRTVTPSRERGRNSVTTSTGAGETVAPVVTGRPTVSRHRRSRLSTRRNSDRAGQQDSSIWRP